MLLKLSDLIAEFKLNIKGIVHVGACRCEEQSIYDECKIPRSNVIWLEGNPDLVCMMKQTNPKLNLYHAMVSDVKDKHVSFMITDNLQSSSLLEFGTHKDHHPWVKETHRITVKTTTLDTFFQNRDTKLYNFMNIDIQGAELMALKGAAKLLTTMDYLYLEVNDEHVYKDCALVHEIDAFLKPFGFRRVKTLMTPHHWGDALYIKQ